LDYKTSETVHNFIYLGLEINYKNEHRNYKFILSASKGFRDISYLLSRNNKPLFYKVLIRPVVTFVSETWVRAKKDEETIGLRVGFLDVSLGQYKRRKNAREDITLKYINYIMK